MNLYQSFYFFGSVSWFCYILIIVQALEVLSVMAAVRLDDRHDKIESILKSTLMDGLASGKSLEAAVDPLASSRWEKVLFGYYLFPCVKKKWSMIYGIC